MTHLTYKSTQYLLSRERDGKIELVNPLTGDLLVVDESERTSFEHITPVYLDTIPNLQHFPSRPASFLTELRIRRESFLREYRLKKQKAPKLEKSPKKVGEKRPRTKKLTRNLTEAIEKLPPELQALIKAQIK